MDLSVAQQIIWPSEEIPDDNSLWMRVHRQRVRDGEIRPNAFVNRGDGMSTNWEKYATPQQTQDDANSPNDNAIVQLIVGEVRKLPGQTVKHTPDIGRNNRAHTDVFGEKSEEVRVKLSRICKIVVPLKAVVLLVANSHSMTI
jgi:hypothetical protein